MNNLPLMAATAVLAASTIIEQDRKPLTEYKPADPERPEKPRPQGQWYQVRHRDWHWWPHAAQTAPCNQLTANRGAWTGTQRTMPSFPCLHCKAAYERADEALRRHIV
jgi:hypothetical protein